MFYFLHNNKLNFSRNLGVDFCKQVLSSIHNIELSLDKLIDLHQIKNAKLSNVKNFRNSHNNKKHYNNNRSFTHMKVKEPDQSKNLLTKY